MTVVSKDMSRVTALLNSEKKMETPLTKTTGVVSVVIMLDSEVKSLEVRTGTLNDAFIRITGEEME